MLLYIINNITVLKMNIFQKILRKVEDFAIGRTIKDYGSIGTFRYIPTAGGIVTYELRLTEFKGERYLYLIETIYWVGLAFKRRYHIFNKTASIRLKQIVDQAIIDFDKAY